MPTVLDSFVLEFGLDASKFSDEQKKLMHQMEQLLNQSKKGGLEIEAAGKKMMDVFSAMRREAIVAFGGFFGGKEILETVNHFAKLETGVARFGKIIGMTARDTMAMGKAFEAFGINKEAGFAALGLMNDQIMNYLGKGVTPEMLRVLGIDARKNGRALKPDEAIMAVAENIAGRGGDARTKAWYLKQGGASDDFISVILEGPEKIRAVFEAQKKMLPNIDADIEKLKKYNEEMTKFSTAWDKLGMAVTRLLAGPLGRIFGGVAEGIDDATNPDKPFVTIDPGSPADRVRKWWNSASNDVHSNLTDDDKRRMMNEIFGQEGIDPSVAFRVYQSEGKGGYVSKTDFDKAGNPNSFGDFQLHYTGDPNHPALGDIFTKETHLDARDPSTTAAQYRFIAKWVKTHGWGDFHGAARAHIGNREGINGKVSSITNNNHVVVNDKSGNPGKTAGLTLESINRANLAYAAGSVAQG